MTSWRALGALPREIWWLAAVTLANRAGTMALPFLILYLTNRMGLAPERAGLLLAVYGVGSIVSAPVAGRLSDRLGPKRMMVGSLALSAAILFCYPLVESFGALAALTLAWSLAADAFPPVSLALTSELAPTDQRKMAFALNRLAANLGLSIGPAVGGLLATVSFAWLFVVDGATSLAAAALLALAPIPSRRLETEAPDRRLSSHALADSRLTLLLIGVFAVAVVYYQTMSTLPLHFSRNLGFTEATIGLLFAFSTLLIVLFEVPVNVRTAHWPHRRTFLLGGLLVGAGFGGTGFVTSPLGVAVTFAVWTAGELALFPAFSAFVADISPEAKRGEYMGLYLLAFNAAFAVGPWLGTQILAGAGPTALWTACLAGGLLATAVLLLASRDSRG
jgi:predicted MFS family arabinose efflux permease